MNCMCEARLMLNSASESNFPREAAHPYEALAVEVFRGCEQVQRRNGRARILTIWILSQTVIQVNPWGEPAAVVVRLVVSLSLSDTQTITCPEEATTLASLIRLDFLVADSRLLKGTETAVT